MSERQCPNCGRIYEEGDWQEVNCPVCDLPLEEIGGESELISDTLSMQLPWPQGEREILIWEANGYLKAQLLKAALESEGIPVLLQGGTMAQVWGVTVGSAGAVGLSVPQSRVDEARQIIDATEHE